MTGDDPATSPDVLGTDRRAPRRPTARRPAASATSTDASSTVAGYRDEAERVAAGLHDLGVHAGTVVSWQLPTAIDTPRAARRAHPPRRGAEPDRARSCASARCATSPTRRSTEYFVVRPEWRGFDYGALAERDRRRDRVHRARQRHAADGRSVGAPTAARSRARRAAGCTTRPVRRPTPRARGTPTRR